MAQLENIEAIGKRLWNAADNLRANSNYASQNAIAPLFAQRFVLLRQNETLRAAGDPLLPRMSGEVAL